MLKATGAEGKIVDPDGGANGVEVTFDEWEAVSKAYSFFLEGENADLIDANGDGYVGREIETGVHFGIDKKVLSLFAGQASPSIDERGRRLTELFALLSHQADFYRGRQAEGVSSGRDGMLVIDRRQGGIRGLRQTD